MKVSELDYDLPKERIARYPAQKRDESSLLVVDRKSETISHAKFFELPDLLPHSFKFFRNDVAVLRARIFAKKLSGGGKVECLLLHPKSGSENVWICLLRPGKRLSVNSVFGNEFFEARVLEKLEDGSACVEFFPSKAKNVLELSQQIGLAPLPPYIARRQDDPKYDRTFDNSRYETLYADDKKRSAAAAPTAGLHFTKSLDDKLASLGHEFFKLTLNVGVGTFQPVKGEILEDHEMHSEFYEIPKKTLNALHNAEGKRLAVGTTSLRALEDFFRKNPNFDFKNADKNFQDSANLFVYPPQKIVSADAVITNFHLPRSTLMCIIAAFLKPNSPDGIKWLLEIYKTAIDKKYNFYSYGDAMLIL